MNTLDVAILAIIALCAIAGYRRGLLRAVYRLVAFFAAIFIAHTLYPFVARALRQTVLLPRIQEGISDALNLESVFYEHATARGAEVIDSLPIPDILQTLLHSYNTPSMFEMLQVTTVEEYVSGFFANIAINGIAILIVFALTLVVLVLVGNVLDIVSSLPVIRIVNCIGGVIFGVTVGAVIIWLGLVITVLFVAGAEPAVYAMLEGSWIAQWLFELTLPQLTVVA